VTGATDATPSTLPPAARRSTRIGDKAVEGFESLAEQVVARRRMTWIQVAPAHSAGYESAHRPPRGLKLRGRYRPG
jgi:hypothetical protein